jgi:hypothetical protein
MDEGSLRLDRQVLASERSLAKSPSLKGLFNSDGRNAHFLFLEVYHLRKNIENGVVYCLIEHLQKLSCWTK